MSSNANLPSDKALIILSKLVNPFVFLISCNTALSSDATMFSSNTPRRILFSMFLINASSSITFPAPKMSSTVIFNASDTDDRPPMWPLANGNKLADETLRTCVTGDSTVLPYCAATFNCSMFLYTPFCIQVSKPFLVCLKTWVSSGVAYSLFISLFNKPKLFTSPIFSASKYLLASAAALLLNNQPSSKPILANLSKDCLLTACVIACDVVVNTDDFKLSSCPNNFLIASGNSSPVLIILSVLKKSFPAIFFKTCNGSAPSCLPAFNILSVKDSANSSIACLSVIFAVFNFNASSLRSLFFVTTLFTIQLLAPSYIFLSGWKLGFVKIAKDCLMYVFKLSNIKFLRSPCGNKPANFSFINAISSPKLFALPCISVGSAFSFMLPFKYPNTWSK